MLERIFSFFKRVPLIKDVVNYFVPRRDELEILRENFFRLCDESQTVEKKHLQAFEAFVEYYKENYDARSHQVEFINYNPVLLLSADVLRLDNYEGLLQIAWNRGFDFNAKMTDDGDFSPGIGNNILLWMVANGNNNAGLQFLGFVEENSLNFEINHQDFIFENTALILVVAKHREGSLVLMEKLIKLEANPNIQNENGHSVLDIAVARRDFDMMKIILQSPLIANDTVERSLQVLEDGLQKSRQIIRDALCYKMGEYEDCLPFSKEVEDEVLQDGRLRNKAQEMMRCFLKKEQFQDRGVEISVGGVTRLVGACALEMNL